MNSDVAGFDRHGEVAQIGKHIAASRNGSGKSGDDALLVLLGLRRVCREAAFTFAASHLDLPGFSRPFEESFTLALVPSARAWTGAGEAVAALARNRQGLTLEPIPDASPMASRIEEISPQG